MANRNNISIQQLRYFLVAARLGSMTLAAKDLHIAQSAVSTAIAQLEQQLDSQLFIRKRSIGLTLTVEGERFAQEAHAVVTHFDETIEEARGEAKKLSGLIRIACFFTLTPFLLPKVLEAMGNEHPDLDIEVIETDTDGVRQALRTGEADLALGYDFGLSNDFDTVLVRQSAPYILLPASHALAKKTELSLRELAEDDLVLLDLPHSKEYFTALLGTLGVTPRVRYRSRSYETVRAMVARGLGYSILNQLPVPEQTYDGGTVVAVSITDAFEPLSIVIAQPRGARTSARSRAFTEQLLSAN